jgi:hypothetical protein
MALPKVTPGTYDYGAYANPKAVQYKGGQQAIGAAVGKLFGDVGKGYMQRMEQDKKDVKEITEFKVNTVGTVDPKVKAGNITDIKAFAEDYGKLKLAKRRNQLSDQEYIEAEAALQSQYQYLQLLPEIFDSGIEGEIDLSRLKGKDAKRNLFLHKAMNSGNVRTSWDSNKKEFNLQWTSDDGETFTESLSGFVSNTKDYLQLKNKFNFADADKQAGIAEIADLVNKNDDYKRYMTDVVYTAEGPKSELNRQKATLGIANSDYINQYEQKYGKDIFEDLLMGMPNIKETEYDPAKHRDMVRQYIAANVVDKVQQVGNNVPVKTETAAKDPRSFAQQLKDANAVNRLNILKDTEIESPVGPVEETGQKPKDFGNTLFEPSKKSGMSNPTPFYNDLKVKMSNMGFDVALEGEIQEEVDGDPVYYPSTIVIKDNFSSQSRTLPLENLTPEILTKTLDNLIKVNTTFLMSPQQEQGGLPIYNQD